MGSAGYTSGNYNGAFNGTSAAAPIVSAVAGLMLSVDPDLTAGEVQDFLASTADDVNADEKPGWDTDLGAGRVNAFRAVSALNVLPESVSNPFCDPDSAVARVSISSEGEDGVLT